MVGPGGLTWSDQEAEYLQQAAGGVGGGEEETRL